MNPPCGISFTKASACGNDFLIADGTQVEGNLAAISRAMCDRHNGVGADGVEWLFPDSEADTNARLFNADGSEAEISGNGTRCVAAELFFRNKKAQLAIRTGAGIKTCHFIREQGSIYVFEADMGEPIVGEQLSIETMWLSAVGTQVSMGNPHYVVFVDNFPQDWQRRGALIGTQPQFPEGTNVEFVRVRGSNDIEIRLFERGVGETQSSGTGSCASAVAAIAGGRVSSPVTVTAPGGNQTVRWEKNVYLLGPAKLICRGELFI